MISIVICLKMFSKEDEPSFLENVTIVLRNEKDTFRESYYMTPKRGPRGPWNYNLVSIFLSLS